MAKTYKCPYCEDRYERKALVSHINKKHEEMIPEGYDSTRIVFDLVNKTDHGICRVCGKHTTWNPKAGRYNVLCDNPKCKQVMRDQYKTNMLKVKGTYNILNDPEQQKIMLANRKISGQYKFQDGGLVNYTGTYEKKCLEFMDVVMNIPSKDIMSPGPTMEYEYNGERHTYIPDFYYIPYNLIIEVKDGGINPNNKHSIGMDSSRAKTIEKERIVTDRGEYNYIRLTNNEFPQLLEMFMAIKEKLINGDSSQTVRINESTNINDKLINLDESIIMNTKDVEYRLDDFKNNQTNRMLIVGFSGSGKTTLAKQLSSNFKNTEFYELDDVVENYRFTDDNLKEYGTMIDRFFKTIGHKYRVSYQELCEKHIDEDHYEKPLLNDFLNYTVSYSQSNKNKKIIFEGIWPLMYDLNPEDFKDWCVIIKGTSYLVSEIRASIRNNNDNPDAKFYTPIIDFIKAQRPKRLTGVVKKMILNINKWSDYFSSDSLLEFNLLSFLKRDTPEYIMNGLYNQLEKYYDNIYKTSQIKPLKPIRGDKIKELDIHSLEEFIKSEGYDYWHKYMINNRGIDTKRDDYPFKYYRYIMPNHIEYFINLITNNTDVIDISRLKAYQINVTDGELRYSAMIIMAGYSIDQIWLMGYNDPVKWYMISPMKYKSVK